MPLIEWQLQMDATIRELGSRSVATVELLGQQGRAQLEILSNQQKSLNNEAELAELQRDLGRGMEEVVEVSAKLREEMQELENRVMGASQRLSRLATRLDK